MGRGLCRFFFSGYKSLFDWVFLKSLKQETKSEMKADGSNCNLFLHTKFPMEKGKKNIIDKCKLKKATGTDEISNKVLKLPQLFDVLNELFQSCFDSSIIPSQWLKTIIKQLPKSSKMTPSYKGLSLISCVYKPYSSLLNCRLVEHFERGRDACG